MAGEYGIATGINQGLQAVTQGMMNVDTIRQNRETQRMNAEKQQAYMQTQQVTQDQSKLQIQELQMKLQEMEKAKAKEDTFNAFNAYEDTKDTKYLNFAAEKNPLLKQIYTKNNIVTTSSINDLSADKLKELGYTDGKYARPIVVTKTDGTQEIQDLTGSYAASGYLKEMKKNQLEDLVLTIKNNQATAIAAQTGVDVATSDLKTSMVTELNAKVESGELTMEQAWQMLNNKGGSSSKEIKPFDIQTAEYFGGLKSKIQNGTATQEELATYDAHLVDKGGTGSATSEKVSRDVIKLQNKGIDLSAEDFDINKLEGKDKVEANTAIRNLENTTAGKALVKNISAKLGDGIGAVQATSKKLADLALDKDVKTGVVKNQIDAVKQYLPEEFNTIEESDLNDIEFRQAFLSVTATMLKLQSGLTVSEAEAQRFAGSMGTLNKNTKVNMSGLKNKVDEIIGDYESNKTLEPTLYNAKYRTPINGLKNVSAQINSYLDNTTPKTTTYKDGQTATNPKTGKTLVFRTDKGWVEE